MADNPAESFWIPPKTWTTGERVRSADLGAALYTDAEFLFRRGLGVVLKGNASQEIASPNGAIFAWSEISYQNSGGLWIDPMWTDDDPSRIVCRYTGLYLLVACVRLEESADYDWAECELQVRYNRKKWRLSTNLEFSVGGQGIVNPGDAPGALSSCAIWPFEVGGEVRVSVSVGKAAPDDSDFAPGVRTSDDCLLSMTLL